MELLINNPRLRTMPDSYVFPTEKRPRDEDLLADDASLALPVINLRATPHDQLVRDIIKAGREFGFFQVVNHGVAEGTVRAFRSAAEEFFAMPAEDKRPYCSDDQSPPFRLASSTTYDRSLTRYWRDYLKLRCYPVAKFAPEWPPSFRECLSEYAAEVQELAATLLRLISEGLGLAGDFFEGDLRGGDTEMNVNYYPPCPEPSLTLGLLPHCAVEPIPGAFVINFGHQMEILTNEALRSVEHRAVTNLAAARMSVATLIMPRMDCRVAPAEEMVSEENPPKYREFVFSEFLEAYTAAAASTLDVLDHFRLR